MVLTADPKFIALPCTVVESLKILYIVLHCPATESLSPEKRKSSLYSEESWIFSPKNVCSGMLSHLYRLRNSTLLRNLWKAAIKTNISATNSIFSAKTFSQRGALSYLNFPFQGVLGIFKMIL
jgi:hypothetical protein